MSSSRKRSLADRLLVLIAERLGPSLDQVDVTDGAGLLLHDLVLEVVQQNWASPSEVRAAIEELEERGFVHVPAARVPQPNLLDGSRPVGLRDRGLVAARRLQPDCGRPVGTVVLCMTGERRAPFFGARIETGDETRDEALKPGLALACFYVVAALRPTKDKPLVVEECRDAFLRFARHGIGPRSGPGTRLQPSAESIRRALSTLEPTVRLRKAWQREDKRRDHWFLAAPFPEVRVQAKTSRHFADWRSLEAVLQCVVRGYPWRAPNGETMDAPAIAAEPPRVSEARNASAQE